MPFYPSYYPQEITLETLTPAGAVTGFQKNVLHAYVGADPYIGKSVPRNVSAVESLASYVVVTFNSAARSLGNRDVRCAAARKLASTFAAGAWTRHPSAITPYHADYLHHFDVIETARTLQGEQAPAAPPLRLRASGKQAEALVGAEGEPQDVAGLGPRRPRRANSKDAKAWDAVVEEVPVRDLMMSASYRVNGWMGPPWIKQGWFHAYLLQASTVSDPTGKQAVKDLYHRLVTGAIDATAERLNVERALVAQLGRGCERVVVGYTTRREYVNSDYSAGVENVASDAHTGLGSAIFVRTVKLKDFPWNGWLTIGIPERPLAAWNPIGGFTDAAGRLIWDAIGDAGLLPDPHGASWIVNRVRLAPSLPTAAPAAIAVPRNALLPQAGTGLWKEVGEGKTAKTGLTYRVLTSAFHDGSKMATADVLHALALGIEWGGANGGTRRDPHVQGATAVARDWLAGLKPLRVETDTLRFGEVEMKYEVPVIEVYLNGALSDLEQLASVSPPWTSVPWHVLVLMEEAVRRGWAAFSAEEAKRRGIPWLDLVRDAKLKERLAVLADELEARGHVPASLAALVGPREARQRWAALKRFAREHGHYLITNGPYRIHGWKPGATVLRVVRDFSYPLGVGSYNAWAIPLRAFVVRTEVKDRRVDVHAEVERIERFAREYRIVTEPLPAALQGKSPLPVCRYVVVGVDGSVVTAGSVEPTDDGVFAVNLQGLPKGGPRRLLLALAVNGNHVNAQVKSLRLD